MSDDEEEVAEDFSHNHLCSISHQQDIAALLNCVVLTLRLFFFSLLIEFAPNIML